MASRRHRRWIALVALLGLLFQQVAMAAYVCPVEIRFAAAATTSTELPPCHRQDNADRARCHQHCHPLIPASDHAPSPTVPDAILPPTTWLRDIGSRNEGECNQVTDEVTARATAPPLTIRDCTFQL
jgi:hypothetical protein